MRRSFLLPLFALCHPAFADTIVVDDDGGPGVDYTTVEAALAAAADDDVLLVREGDYAPSASTVVTDRAITLRADPPGAAVSIDVRLRIRDLGPADTARIEGVEVRNLELTGCAGGVVLDSVTTGELHVEDCTNVRVVDGLVDGSLLCTTFIQCAEVAVDVLASYVAFENSQIRGNSDFDHSGYNGSHGLRLGDDSVVRFRDSLAVGGFGGDGSCLFERPGGDGGHGIIVLAGSRLLVEGESGDRPALGGYPGEGCWWKEDEDGEPGADLFVEGFVQLNGVLAADFWTIVEEPGAVVEEDPYAPRLSGAFSAGAIDLAVEGRPGGFAHLLVARRPAFMVRPAIDEPLLVDPLRLEPIGALDGSGALAHTVALPPTLAPGATIVVQVLVTDGSGRRLTDALLLTAP